MIVIDPDLVRQLNEASRDIEEDGFPCDFPGFIDSTNKVWGDNNHGVLRLGGLPVIFRS